MRIFVKVKEGDRIHLTVPPHSGVVSSVWFVSQMVNGFYYIFGIWSPHGPISPVVRCQVISLSLWMHPVGADKVSDILYQ